MPFTEFDPVLLSRSKRPSGLGRVMAGWRSISARSNCLREVLATGESDDKRRPAGVFVQEQKM